MSTRPPASATSLSAADAARLRAACDTCTNAEATALVEAASTRDDRDQYAVLVVNTGGAVEAAPRLYWAPTPIALLELCGVSLALDQDTSAAYRSAMRANLEPALAVLADSAEAISSDALRDALRLGEWARAAWVGVRDDLEHGDSEFARQVRAGFRIEAGEDDDGDATDDESDDARAQRPLTGAEVAAFRDALDEPEPPPWFLAAVY